MPVLLMAFLLATLPFLATPARAGLGKYMLGGLVAKAVTKAGTKVGHIALKKLILHAKKSPKIRNKIISLANTYIGHNETMDAAAQFVISSVEKGGIDQKAFDRFVEVAKADAVESAQELTATGAASRFLKSPLKKKLIEKAMTAKDYYEYLKQKREDYYQTQPQ